MDTKILTLWKKIELIMDHSLFFRFIDWVMNVVGRFFSGSIFVRLLSTELDQSVIENSFIGKLLNGFLGLISSIRNKFSLDLFQNADIYKLVSDMKKVICKYLDNSLILKLLHIFEFSITDLGLLDIGIIAIVGLSPFLPTMVLAGMLGLIFVFFVINMLFVKDYSVKFDLTGIFLIMFIIVTIFTGFTSLARRPSMNIAFLTTLFMLSFFLVIFLINTVEKFYALVFVFSISAVVTGFYGLYQKYSGMVDMTWVDKTLFEGEKLRVFSTFENPNVYGEYLLLAIPISLAMIFVSKKILAKLYYLGITAVLTLNLMLTLSRGCYLALVLSVLVFILFVNKRLITFFSAGVFALPFVLPPSVINRILSISNTSDSSTSYRITIWQATIRMLRDFWFVGLGQGYDAYNAIYPLYSFNAVFAPHSHNLYLQVFVETGIFGLIVFLLVLFAFFKTMISFFCKAKSLQVRVFTATIIAAVVGFLFQGVFDYVFYNYRVFLLFFITLGIGAAYVRIHQMKGAGALD